MKHTAPPRRMVMHGSKNTPHDGNSKWKMAAHGEWKLRHGTKPNRAERRAMGGKR